MRVGEDLTPGDDDQAVGYGTPGSGDKLAIKLRSADARTPGPAFHLASSADTHAAVDAFHAAALCNGGQDNGAPGLRPDYRDSHYAAFVVDPDGHRLEAVLNPMH